jgi:hypothetical protein
MHPGAERRAGIALLVEERNEPIDHFAWGKAGALFGGYIHDLPSPFDRA